MRAASASTADAMIRQDSHKTTAIASVAVANKRSATFFDIHFGNGEEIADFVYNYKSGGIEVQTVGVMYYGSGVRAADASPEDALLRQDTHDMSELETQFVAAGIQARSNPIYAPNINAIQTSNRMASTFFDQRLGKGDEVANYSFNYITDGETVKNTTLFYYEAAGAQTGLQRATTADTAAALKKQSVYILNHFDNNNTRKVQDIYLVGTKNNEITDYSKQYTKDGLVVATEVSFYDASGSRASVSDERLLAKRITYRRDAKVTSDSISADEDLGALIKASESLFDNSGGTGEEFVTKTLNYSRNGNTVISNTAYVYAGTSAARILKKQNNYVGTGNTKLISTVDFTGDSGLEKVAKITSRKGVEQVYSYKGDGDLDKVMVDNGTLTQYKKNQFQEDEIDYTMDYRGVKTNHAYDANGILQKTTSNYTASDGAGGLKTVTTETTFVRDSFLEERVSSVTGDFSQENYFYDPTSQELAYTVGVARGKTTTTYFKRNEFNEDLVDYLIEDDGRAVHYNYQEISDPTAQDDYLRFRTILTRTLSPGQYSSYDSITILDKYGENCISINSAGVSQHYRTVTPDAGGIPIAEQVSVLDAVYRYDLSGQLLSIEQDEVNSFTDSKGNVLYYPIRVKYTYEYTINQTTGEIMGAEVLGTIGGNPYKKQVFNGDMQLVETYDYKIGGFKKTAQFTYYTERGSATSQTIRNAVSGITLSDPSKGKFRVGDKDVNLDSDTTIFDFDGNTLTAADFLQRYEENKNSFYTQLTASQVSDGTWHSDSIKIIKAPIVQTTGRIDSFSNPSGVSAIHGVAESVTPNVNGANSTIRFSNQDIHILDSTVVIDAAGHEIKGSHSQKAQQLQNIKNSLDEKGIFTSLQMVTQKVGDEWQADQIIVTVQNGQVPDIGEMKITGNITGFDEAAGTIQFDGKTIDISEAALFNIVSDLITKENLKTIFSANQAAGNRTVVTIKASHASGNWTATEIKIVSSDTGSGELTGLLEAVRTTGERSITLSGRELLIADTSVIKDAAGNTLTVNELSALLNANVLAGVQTKVDVQFDVTKDGLILSALNILEKSTYTLTTTSRITGIAADTITINGGISFEVNGDTTLSGVEAITDFSVDDTVTVKLIKTTQGWIADFVQKTDGFKNEITFSGPIGNINVADGTLMLGGLTVSVDADSILLGKNDEAISGGLTGLAALLGANNSMLTSAVISLDENGQYILNSLKVEKITEDSIKLSTQDAQILARDADGNPTQLLINGLTVDIGNSTATDGFFTEVEIGYFDERESDDRLRSAVRKEGLNDAELQGTFVDSLASTGMYELFKTLVGDHSDWNTNPYVQVWESTPGPIILPNENTEGFRYDSYDDMVDLYKWNSVLGYTTSYPDDTPSWVLFRVGYANPDDFPNDDMPDIFEIRGGLAPANQPSVQTYSKIFRRIHKDNSETYDLIGGLGGMLDGTMPNAISQDSHKVVDVTIVKVGDSYRATKINITQEEIPDKSVEVRGQLTGLSTADSTITLGDRVVTITGSKIKDYSGNLYTLKEFEDLYNANQPSEVFLTGKITQNANGVWQANELLIESGVYPSNPTPVFSVTGDTATLENGALDEIMANNRLKINGIDAYLNSGTILPSGFDSVQEFVDFLALNLETGKQVIFDAEFYNSSNWQVKSIKITQISSAASLDVTGTITGVDPSAHTVQFGTQSVTVEPDAQFYINTLPEMIDKVFLPASQMDAGNALDTITAQNVADRILVIKGVPVYLPTNLRILYRTSTNGSDSVKTFAQMQTLRNSNAQKLRFTENIEYKDGKWTFTSDVTFQQATPDSQQRMIDTSGVVESMAVDGKFVVNGISIAPASTVDNITLNDKPVTLDEVRTRFNTPGVFMWLEHDISATAIIYSSAQQAWTASSGVPLKFYSVQKADLDDLKAKYEKNTAKGLPLNLDFKSLQKLSDNLWSSKEKEFFIADAPDNSGVVPVLQAFSLIRGVDPVKRTISIGGSSLLIPEGTTIQWVENISDPLSPRMDISFEELQCRLELFGVVQLANAEEIKKSADGLIELSDDTLTVEGLFDYFDIVSLSGVDSVDTIKKSITIGGKEILVPDGIALKWADTTGTIQTVSMDELKNLAELGAIVVYEPIDSETLLVKTLPNGLSYFAEDATFSLPRSSDSATSTIEMRSGSSVTDVNPDLGLVYFGDVAVNTTDRAIYYNGTPIDVPTLTFFLSTGAFPLQLENELLEFQYQNGVWVPSEDLRLMTGEGALILSGLEGVIQSADPALNSMTVNGIKISLDSVFIFDPNLGVLDAATLQQILSTLPADQYLWYSASFQYTFDSSLAVWNADFTPFNFVPLETRTRGPAVASPPKFLTYEGYLSEIKTSDGKDTLIISGLPLALSENYSLELDGSSVTVAQLKDALSANQTAGVLTKIDSLEWQYTSNGWEIPASNGNVLRFSSQTQNIPQIKSLHGTVDGVQSSDSGLYSITTNNLNISIPQGYQVYIDGKLSDITALARVFANNERDGVKALLDPVDIISTVRGWIFNTSSQSIYVTSGRTSLDMTGGVIRAMNYGDHLNIDGIDALITANTLIKDENNILFVQESAPRDLAGLLARIGTSLDFGRSLTVDVIISAAGNGEPVIDSIEIKAIESLGSATLNNIEASSVTLTPVEGSSSEGTLTYQGVSYDIDTAAFTAVTTLSGNTLSLAELEKELKYHKDSLRLELKIEETPHGSVITAMRFVSDRDLGTSILGRIEISDKPNTIRSNGVAIYIEPGFSLVKDKDGTILNFDALKAILLENQSASTVTDAFVTAIVVDGQSVAQTVNLASSDKQIQNIHTGLFSGLSAGKITVDGKDYPLSDTYKVTDINGAPVDLAAVTQKNLSHSVPTSVKLSSLLVGGEWKVETIQVLTNLVAKAEEAISTASGTASGPVTVGVNTLSMGGSDFTLPADTSTVEITDRAGKKYILHLYLVILLFKR